MSVCDTKKQGDLQRIIREADGNSLDIYYTLCEEFLSVSDNSEAPLLLRTILEYPDKIGKEDEVSQKVSSRIENEVIHGYKQYVNSTVALLTRDNDSVEIFYEKLWSTIFCMQTSPRGPEQRAVVLKLLNEDVPVLPYYQAKDMISMDDEDFSKRVGQLEPRLREATHMLNRNFSQKTEEISQIYRLAKNLSKEDACVYWAVLFNLAKKYAFRMGYEAKSDGGTRKETEQE